MTIPVLADRIRIMQAIGPRFTEAYHTAASPAERLRIFRLSRFIQRAVLDLPYATEQAGITDVAKPVVEVVYEEGE